MYTCHVPNYNVQARVVDLRVDTPTKEDRFLVDSNVWFWSNYEICPIPFYSKEITPPQYYQITKYPRYLEKAMYAEASLFCCGLSLAELAHLIEKIEKDIFQQTHGEDRLDLKIYRHNHPDERKKVFNKVRQVWDAIMLQADCVDLKVNNNITQSALFRFETQLVDGYDLFILEAMRQAKIDKIITDDGDYVTVPDITVFTASNNVINAAREQGKLLVR